MSQYYFCDALPVLVKKYAVILENRDATCSRQTISRR